MTSYKRKAEAAVLEELRNGAAPSAHGNSMRLGRRRLTHPNNTLTAAGEAFETRGGTVSNWQPGTWIEGDKTYARKSNGQPELVAFRDAQGRLKVT